MFINALKRLWLKDTSKIEEVGNFNVLIRCLSLINILYVIILMFYNIILFKYNRTFVYIGLLVAFIITILLTYKSKYITVYLYTILFLIEILYSTILYGTTVGYHLGVFSLMLIFFYDSKRKFFEKFILSCLCCFLVFVIWLLAGNKGSYLPTSFRDILWLSIIYMIYLSFNYILITCFYYIKFAQAEEKLMSYNEELKNLSYKDSLTQLNNRRGAIEYIKNLQDKEVVFAMGDIDFFKTVNDTYGHDIGDEVLVKVADELTKYFDKQGLITRWGGEEFLIISNKLSLLEMKTKLEKFSKELQDVNFIVGENTFNVTMTFGIALGKENVINNYENIIKIADENLYVGKNSGRNCIILKENEG